VGDLVSQAGAPERVSGITAGTNDNRRNPSRAFQGFEGRPGVGRVEVQGLDTPRENLDLDTLVSSCRGWVKV